MLYRSFQGEFGRPTSCAGTDSRQINALSLSRKQLIDRTAIDFCIEARLKRDTLLSNESDATVEAISVSTVRKRHASSSSNCLGLRLYTELGHLKRLTSLSLTDHLLSNLSGCSEK